MQKIFEQYGGVITTAMAIVALVGLLGMLFTPGGTGWMDGAFHNVIDGFEDKTENAIKVANGKTLEGSGQTFYTLAPSTLTFGSKAPKSEFQAIKINGETLTDSHYTVTDAEPGTTVTLSLDYLKTLDAASYNIEVVSETMIPRGTFSVVEPELNAHGFYYNQPYTAYVSALGDTEAFFIRDDGTLDIIDVSTMYTQTGTYTVSGDTLTVNCNLGTLTGTVSADGTEIYCNELATAFQLGSEAIAADEEYIYVYRDSLGGYEVTCIDKTKASYGPIRTGINDQPTVALHKYMFNNNTNLVVAPVVPHSVTTIYEGAFYKCINLTSVTIPDSVTSIGQYAFRECASLTSVTFGENSQLTTIGDFAFYGCTNLTSITIPDGVTDIGDDAFEDCTSLTSIAIPDGVTTIGKDAFYGCTNLKSIAIPDSVTSIGDSAFYECESLTSITIPDSITSIGEAAFCRCTSLNNVTLPDSVTSIGDNAFEACTSLESIDIPEGVTSIGNSAFQYCENLTSIAIPDSVTSIGDNAFRECESLTSVDFGENSQLTSIGYWAFQDCTSLASIAIPDSVTSIGQQAFRGCTNLVSITIPDSVTEIDYYAFYECTSLTNVTFKGTKAQWNAIAKLANWNYGCGAITVTCTDGTVTVPANNG